MNYVRVNTGGALECNIWENGIICAFEFVRGSNNTTTETISSKIQSDNLFAMRDGDCHWVPIGWNRIVELVNTIQFYASWSSQQINLVEGEDDFIVDGVVAPYWKNSEGPIWWCHVFAGSSLINSWLSDAFWLPPTIRIALSDVSRPISECLKNFMYQTQKFLVTALHVKGSGSNINIPGITEVQKLLLVGGSATPKSVHEVIAHLASRISRWDDRVFRISIFVAADEIELKFANRSTNDDLNPLTMILHEEIKSLTTQVIGVKLTLHAREEIVFELLQHLRGTPTKNLLEGIIKNTRKMLEELEAVRDRLFNIQFFLQSTINTELQDKSMRVTHTMAILGGCALFLSLVLALFGISLDGIPGAVKTPYAFPLFTVLFTLFAIVLIWFCMRHFGFKNGATEEEINARKLEHQQLISMFRHDLETRED